MKGWGKFCLLSFASSCPFFLISDLFPSGNVFLTGMEVILSLFIFF